MTLLGRSTVLRAVLAVLAAIAFWVVWMTAAFLVFINYAPVEWLDTIWAPLIWYGIPQLVASCGTVLIAGWIYGRFPLTSLTAGLVVLGFPVVQVFAQEVSAVVTSAPASVLIMWPVTGALGIGAGLALLRPLNRP